MATATQAGTSTGCPSAHRLRVRPKLPLILIASRTSGSTIARRHCNVRSIACYPGVFSLRRQCSLRPAAAAEFSVHGSASVGPRAPRGGFTGTKGRRSVHVHVTQRNGKEQPAANGEQEENISVSSTSIYNYSVSRSMEQISRTNRKPQSGPAGLRNGAVTAQRPKQSVKDAIGTLFYNYYNWRTGTGNDIITFVFLGMFVIAGLVSINYALLHYSPDINLRNLWISFYEVVQLSFQDGFPEPDDPDVQKLVAVGVASTGLVLFTILLALVEQFFLEVLETNVERGSQVYEKGHVLVLSWMESALSLTAVWKVLQQVCEANKAEGGAVIVVLTNESKLKMEQMFARFIPDEQRYGSQLVFRQGSPLIPDNLKYVSAKTAGKIIIVSDSSRASAEADAQALRVAVLLDEMWGPREPRGLVVVELKTGVSAQLVRSVCSDYVIPLSTYNMNSIRLARMVQRPITAYVTNNMLDHGGKSQHTVAGFPELAGTPFRNLKYMFPDCTVMGVMNVGEGRCDWMPHNYTLNEGDELFLLRNPSVALSNLKPTPMSPKPDLSSEWVKAIEMKSIDDTLKVLESETPDQPVVKVSAALQEAVEKVTEALPEEVSGSFGELTEVSDMLFSMLSSRESEGEQKEGVSEGGGGSGEEEPLSLKSLESMDEEDELAATSEEVPVVPEGGERGAQQQAEFLNIGMNEEDCTPEVCQEEQLRVLVIGASENQFMAETINEFDRGLAALPQGSEVTLYNNHLATDLADDVQDELDTAIRCVSRIKVDHISGDPLNPQQLEELPLERYNSIIILCDKSWMDPDVDSSNGIDARDTGDMLRIDSLVMMVQINARTILTKRGCRNVKVIVEKVAFEGDTRFDDPLKLPLGFTFNRKDFGARLVAQIAVQPKILPIMSSGAQGTHYEMRDPEMFVAPGEKMNYWALMERVEDLGEHLLGYVELPKSTCYELEVVINPTAQFRNIKIAWGNRQLKLITNSRRETSEAQPAAAPKKRTGQASEVQRAQAAAKKRSRRVVSSKDKKSPDQSTRELLDIALRTVQRQRRR